MGEDGKLVTTCCDSSGGLGESLLLVELKVFIPTVNITATNVKLLLTNDCWRRIHLCSSDLVSSTTGRGVENS